MLLETSKTPKRFGVLGKPQQKRPLEKVSGKTRQMWRIDTIFLEIPPEPQAQMKLELCGFSGYTGILWATGGEGRQEYTSLPTVKLTCRVPRPRLSFPPVIRRCRLWRNAHFHYVYGYV
jgi:hypothetical protein